MRASGEAERLSPRRRVGDWRQRMPMNLAMSEHQYGSCALRRCRLVPSLARGFGFRGRDWNCVMNETAGCFHLDAKNTHGCPCVNLRQRTRTEDSGGHCMNEGHATYRATVYATPSTRAKCPRELCVSVFSHTCNKPTKSGFTSPHNSLPAIRHVTPGWLWKLIKVCAHHTAVEAAGADSHLHVPSA